MTRRSLSLKRETLAEITEDALAGVAAGTSYTGQLGCVLSFRPPCVSSFCSGLDCIETS